MFSIESTVARTAIDDSSYIFDQTQDDIIMPMSNDTIHLKSAIAPTPAISDLGYGRESSASSVHYGYSHDTSEPSTGQEGEDSTPGACVGGYAASYTPSPLQHPFTPNSAVYGVTNIQSNQSLQSELFQHNITSEKEAKAHLSLKDQRGDGGFIARTPQSLSRESQASSTPELQQSSEQPKKHRRTNSLPSKGRVVEMKASSSIPAELSWPEFGRQCILAAESSRLNPFTLHPAEYKLLREHVTLAQVTVYLNIRNAILRLWHRNPLVYVSLEEAAGCARDKRYFGLARVAYLWLMRNGYINFGCVDVPNTVGTIAKSKAKNTTRRTIIVVGAGMSGLGCARHLEGLFAQLGDQLTDMGERPPRIIILEARPRVGGRVYSHPFLNQKDSTLPPGHRCTAEMGAQIVTGFEHGNPLNAIIRGQLAIPYHGLRDNTILYDYDGTVVEMGQDILVEKLYNDVLERAAVYRNKPAASMTVEGNRDQMNLGRDPADNGGPTIAELEDSHSSLSGNATSIASAKRETNNWRGEVGREGISVERWLQP
ncbi:Lysine-specific histone demethylase 1 [Pyrenophora tritici-repentis]|nr:Lysine-specific histone demethylase 1 [Pyrenophora tritici-repentis]